MNFLCFMPFNFFVHSIISCLWFISFSVTLGFVPVSVTLIVSPQESAGPDDLIALAADHIHHVCIGVHMAAHHLRENSCSTAGDQCHTLLVLLYRLLAVAGLYIPEHDPGQLVAVLAVQRLCLLKVCE